MMAGAAVRLYRDLQHRHVGVRKQNAQGHPGAVIETLARVETCRQPCSARAASTRADARAVAPPSSASRWVAWRHAAKAAAHEAPTQRRIARRLRSAARCRPPPGSARCAWR